MAQYNNGTVSVDYGAQVVHGIGTAWVGAVSPGDLLLIDPAGPIGTVGSVQSDSQITLQDAWAGTSVSGASYAMHRDFHPTSGLPLMAQGQQYTHLLYNRLATLTSNRALSPTGVVPGAYGSANMVPTLGVDAQGRVTVATSLAMDPAQLAGKPASYYSDAKNLTGRVPLDVLGSGVPTANSFLRGDGSWGSSLVGDNFGPAGQRTLIASADGERVEVYSIGGDQATIGWLNSAGTRNTNIFVRDHAILFTMSDFNGVPFSVGRDSGVTSNVPLVANAGVRFPSGGALTDYQEGSFTAVLTGTLGGAYELTNTAGHFVKVGKLVTCFISLLSWRGTVTPYDGMLAIAGLPFACGEMRGTGTIGALSFGINPAPGGIKSWSIVIDPQKDFAYIVNMLENGGFSHFPEVSSSGGAWYAISFSYLAQS